MKFQCALIAVKDLQKSLKFYHDLFEQEVAMDLGANVTLSGGFVLQEGFSELVGFSKESVKEKSHNMELYFEVDNFSAFMEKLENYPDINFIHAPKTYPWHQKVVRIYDPDFHIIEVGEGMDTVVMRLFQEGLTPKEVAKETTMPLPFVLACKEGLL